MGKLLDNLKKYFATTPKERLDKDWNEIKELNDIGVMSKITLYPIDNIRLANLLRAEQKLIRLVLYTDIDHQKQYEDVLKSKIENISYEDIQNMSDDEVIKKYL